MLQRFNVATTSIRRVIIDNLVTPEDFVEGPLKDWTKDFGDHVKKSKSTLNQINLVQTDGQYSNLEPHLATVINACSRKVSNSPDPVEFNFTQEYIEAQITIPFDKRDNSYRLASESILKSMALMEKTPFADVVALKDNFLKDEAGVHVVDAAFPQYYEERSRLALHPLEALSREAKQQKIFNSAKTVLAGLAYNRADPMYRQSFCFCWKLMIDHNEIIGGLASDQTVALLLGSAAFIDVYPLLKEPGGTPFFAKTLLDLGVGETTVYHVQSVCKATLKGLYKHTNKKVLALITGAVAIYRLMPANIFRAAVGFAHNVSEHLHLETQKPTDLF